jgi:hypothetical protein
MWRSTMGQGAKSKHIEWRTHIMSSQNKAHFRAIVPLGLEIEQDYRT